jgi:hypothetical protein
VVTEAILVPTVDDCTFWRLLRVLADVGVRLEVCLGRRGGSDIGVVVRFSCIVSEELRVVVVRGEGGGFWTMTREEEEDEELRVVVVRGEGGGFWTMTREEEEDEDRMIML